MPPRAPRRRVMLAAMLLAGLWAALSAGSAVDAGGTVRVRAALLSSTGTPIGGRVALVAVKSGSVLWADSVDPFGEVDLEVAAAPDDTSFVLLAHSKGMRRNTADNYDWEGHRTLALGLDGSWWSAGVFQFDLPGASELAQSPEPERSTILVDREGRRTLDLVKRTAQRGEDGSVDFGTVRFPSAHATVELTLDLRAADGTPFADPILLVGFLGMRSTTGGNRVYPHMALGQRGARARVLLTRAAARLLFADPERFLRVAPGSRAREHTTVRVPEEALRVLREGGVASVKVTMVPDPPERREPESRPAPEEPAFWDLAEQSFVW